MRRLDTRRFILAGLMMTTVLSNTACFASFPLTRKLYAFNKGLGDKWVQELFFLATGVILPVYGVAGLIDMVILNSMEFWTGKPAMTSSGPETKVKVVAQGDVKLTQTMTRSAEGRTMILEESVKGQFHSRTTMTQATGASLVTAQTVYADGRTESRMLTVDEAGRVTVSGSKMLSRTLTTSEIESVVSRLSVMGGAN
jgi:hypothetical protein